MSERAPRVVLILTACVCGAALLFVAWLGTFSRFIADDFCAAVAARKVGLLTFALQSGRFASNLLLGAIASGGGSVAHFVSVLSILAIVASALFAVRRLTKLNWAASCGVALAISWALLGCSPDQFQSVFWTTGVVTYTVPLALVMIWAGCARNPLSHLLLFIAGGFSATLTLILAGGLIALFFAGKRTIAIGGMIALATAALIMRPPLAMSVQAMAADAVLFLSIEGATAGLALLLVFTLTAIVSPQLQKKHVLLAIGFALWSLVVPFLLGNVPLRALQTSHAALVAAAAIAGWSIGQRPRVVMMVLAVLLLIPVASEMRRFITISAPAAGFAREWDDIDEQLRGMRGAKGTVMVRAPQSIGTLAYINASPDHWANRCMADYYGLEKIASPEAGQ